MRAYTFLTTLILGIVIECQAEEFRTVVETTKIQSPAINEASGLACSSFDSDFLWIVNDSGGSPDIHLVKADGAYCGKLMLKNTSNIDWEDLASFTIQGRNYLLVADIGDNNSKRDFVTLHIVREPSLPVTGQTLVAATVPEWQVQFRYEGGPRDCESVAVDAEAGKIILISKRSQPPEIFELPLEAPKDKEIQTARLMGKTAVKSMDSLIPFRDQPTGLDIMADNSHAAIITYSTIFIFPRKPGESWAEAFSKTPTPLAQHLLGQAESVAFSKDGKTIYAVSEGKNPPIKRYQR